MKKLTTEELKKPKKKPKCSVQGKRNITSGSSDALGNRQNKCIIFFSFCSAKIVKWKIFSHVLEGQMIIRNNIRITCAYPFPNSTYFFQHNAQTLLLAYVLCVSCKRMLSVSKCFISPLLDNAEKMLPFSE